MRLEPLLRPNRIDEHRESPKRGQPVAKPRQEVVRRGGVATPEIRKICPSAARGAPAKVFRPAQIIGSGDLPIRVLGEDDLDGHSRGDQPTRFVSPLRIAMSARDIESGAVEALRRLRGDQAFPRESLDDLPAVNALNRIGHRAGEDDSSRFAPRREGGEDSIAIRGVKKGAGGIMDGESLRLLWRESQTGGGGVIASRTTGRHHPWEGRIDLREPLGIRAFEIVGMDDQSPAQNARGGGEGAERTDHQRNPRERDRRLPIGGAESRPQPRRHDHDPKISGRLWRVHG